MAAWPTEPHHGADHAATAIRPVEIHKAWREQFHRMIAGALGVVTLVLALWAARRRRFGLHLDARFSTLSAWSYALGSLLDARLVGLGAVFMLATLVVFVLYAWASAVVRERVLGTDERIPTLLFNGYGEEVAQLDTAALYRPGNVVLIGTPYGCRGAGSALPGWVA
mgnify:CR=1 FL=1